MGNPNSRRARRRARGQRQPIKFYPSFLRNRTVVFTKGDALVAYVELSRDTPAIADGDNIEWPAQTLQMA